jgi:hypothetical protein
MPVRKSRSSSQLRSSSAKRKVASARSKHRRRSSHSSNLAQFGSGQRRRAWGTPARRKRYLTTYTPPVAYGGPYGGQYDQATYPPGEARSRTMRVGLIGGMILLAVVGLCIFAAVIALSL